MLETSWDVNISGTVFGFIFYFFVSGLQKAQCFGLNETSWLMATGRATREALWSEAGFENVFWTQNWVRGLASNFISAFKLSVWLQFP